MVVQRRIKLSEKLLSEGSIRAFSFELSDDWFLMCHMLLSLGDVALGPQQVFARVRHTSR
jgi:hypothetical protein